MAEPLQALVAAALARIRNPRLDNDLLSAGMVRDLVVSDDGAVSFTFLLAPEDPATLVRQARTAVQGIEGVRRDAIKIAVTNPAGPAKVTHAAPSGGEAGPPPPTPDMPDLGRIIAISSGKGGVGKSTVSANLDAATCLIDHGVGVIRVRQNSRPLRLATSDFKRLRYRDLAEHYRTWMNTIEFSDITRFVAQGHLAGTAPV